MAYDSDLASDNLEQQALWMGIAQFNQGEFYACHDTLEAIWMQASTPDKPFYQGILQLAVAFYHLGNHNWRGAAILMGEGLNRLRPYEPAYAGVNVTGLIDLALVWLTALQALGEDGLDTLIAALEAMTPTTITGITPALQPPQIWPAGET